MKHLTRRSFLKTAGAAAIASGLAVGTAESARRDKRPNVLIFITDDQGFGDLGAHGNEIIRTPNLDRFAEESVEFSQFNVCPVCAPTRACLMTGRYNYRTRAIDTWKGRAMMDPEEFTLAEALGRAGYRTGIFGKWHLGDNYPMRTIDQGFEESVIHLGGGLEQPSGPPGNHYFDPVLVHNGEPEKYRGYCMDIYAEEAITFMEEHRDEPFFVYLPTNTPHDPLHVDEKYMQPYLDKGVDERNARLYGMVENIDENFGRVTAKLDELGLADDTIVMFMSDNGPWLGKSARYNAGLRGSKGTVYEGGLRVPFFIRWNTAFRNGRAIDRIAAHIDIMPTVLDACGVETGNTPVMDGVSLMPLLRGERADWPDRTLFFQWHRGDEPQLYRCFAARSQRYKLVQAAGGAGKEGIIPENTFRFELFDIERDPYEKNDLSSERPEIVKKLKNEYEAWFRDVSAERGYDPPRIQLGTPHENPVVLSRQDWRGSSGWSDKDLGYWEVNVMSAGKYDIKVLLSEKIAPENSVVFRMGNVTAEKPVRGRTLEYAFRNIELPAGEGRFEAWTMLEGKRVGPMFVEVARRE